MSQSTSDQPQADVVLIEKDGRFFVFQPDIGVIVSDEKVEGAYGKFLEARRTFLSEVAHAGLTVAGRGMVAAARGASPTVAIAPSRERGIVAELALFVVKLTIVLAVIGCIGAVLAVRAASGVASALDQVKVPKQLSFEDVVHKAVDIAKDIQSLTKEEKETLVRSVGTISRELDPVIDAWRNPPPQ